MHSYWNDQEPTKDSDFTIQQYPIAVLSKRNKDEDYVAYLFAATHLAQIKCGQFPYSGTVEH